MLSLVSKWSALCLLVVLTAEYVSAGRYNEQCDLGLLRLPETFTPSHYYVAVAPNLHTMTFEGLTQIYTNFNGIKKEQSGKKCSRTQRIGKLIGQAARKLITCGCSSMTDENEDACEKRIVLHVGKLIALDEVKVFEITNTDAPVTGDDLVESVCLDKPAEMMAINLKVRANKKRRYRIDMRYFGKIGVESRGLYQSDLLNVTDGHKNSQFDANTHFFPADARSAFPCFDEPHLKATFQLKIMHAHGLHAISNTEPEFVGHSEANEDGRSMIVRFKKTEPMSTYNFAFAVGRYEPLVCPTNFRVVAYCPLGRSQEAQFVLKTICDAIPVAQDYFGGLEFPLKKLDIVVTSRMRDPSRENWGVLVITEDFLLTDQDTTNVLRVEIAKLAVHIVLHQWYGDLVTAKWWDDQWIFDGFTIWQSHWSSSKLFPEFNYDFNYLLRLQSPMLDAHTNHTVHAIKTHQPLDANQELTLFDPNTYNKAGGLYNMLNSLDPELFRRALGEFVRTFRYSSADAEDFLGVVKRVTGWNFVDELVTSWLDLPGIPLVSVKLIQEGGADYLELSQERLVDVATSGNQLWFIPVQVVVHDGQNVIEETIVHLREQKMRYKLKNSFDSSNENHFVKLNGNFNGFYRVKYDDNLQKRLIAPVRSQVLSPADRFNVIDDLRGLLRLGRVDSAQVEQILTESYVAESDGGVLSGLATVLPVLSGHQEDHARMQQLAFDLFSHVFEELKFQVVEGEAHKTMNGRQDALMVLVQYGHQAAIEEALRVFDESDVHLATFLRKPVYLAVSTSGSEEQFAQLVQRVEATKSLYERQILVAGLAPYLSGAADRRQRLLATLA